MIRVTAHIDVLPTLIGLCGLRPPHPTLSPTGGEGTKEPLAPRGGEGRVRGDKVTFDGADLRPLLTGKGDWPDLTEDSSASN